MVTMKAEREKNLNKKRDLLSQNVYLKDLEVRI